MPLTTQTIRQLLRLGTVSVLVTSGFLVWLAFVRPSISAVATDDITIATPRTVAQPQRTRDLSEFAPLLTRSLGAPLYDSPSQEDVQADQTPEETLAPESDVTPAIPQQPTPPTREPLLPKSTGLRLMGTMIEVGGSIAILADVDGGVRLAKVGDSIETDVGEGKIDAIELQQVTLSIDGDSVTLKVPR